jgi:hypothetical protein
MWINLGCCADEDQMVWMWNKAQGKFMPTTASTDHYAFPIPASFRASHILDVPSTPNHHTHAGRLPHMPVLSRHERTAAWSDEVHRRHVARTARVRQCLSPKQRRKDQVVLAATPITPAANGVVGVGGVGIGGGALSYDGDNAYSFSLPLTNGDSHHHPHHSHRHQPQENLEDVRL